jgi:glutaredoxin-related protein
MCLKSKNSVDGLTPMRLNYLYVEISSNILANLKKLTFHTCMGIFDRFKTGINIIGIPIVYVQAHVYLS